MSTRRDWRDGALCLQIPAEIFHNEGQGAGAHEALRVCSKCDVRDACLETALRIERDGVEPHGVAGGKSAAERLRIIRAERRAHAGQVAA